MIQRNRPVISSAQMEMLIIGLITQRATEPHVKAFEGGKRVVGTIVESTIIESFVVEQKCKRLSASRSNRTTSNCTETLIKCTDAKKLDECVSNASCVGDIEAACAGE